METKLNNLLLKGLLIFVTATMVLMDFVGLSSLVSIDYNDLTLLGGMGMAVAFIIAVITNLIHGNPMANARVGYIGTLIAVCATVMFSANTLFLILDTSSADRTNSQATNAGLEAQARTKVMAEVHTKVAALEARRNELMNSKAVGYKGRSKLSVAAATLNCGDPEKMGALSSKSRRYKLEWIAFNQAACDEIAGISGKIREAKSPSAINSKVQAGISEGWQDTKEMNLIERYALNSEGMKELMSYALAMLIVVLVHLLREVVYPSSKTDNVRSKQIKSLLSGLKWMLLGVFRAPWNTISGIYNQFKEYRKKREHQAALKSIAGGTPVERAMILTRGEYATQSDAVKDSFLAVMNAWAGNEGKPVPGGTYAWIKANTLSPHRSINNAVCATTVEFSVRHGVLVNTNPTSSKQQRRYGWGQFNIDSVKQYCNREEVSEDLKTKANA